MAEWNGISLQPVMENRLFWDKLACQYEHGKTVPVTSHYHNYAQYRLMRLVMNE